MPTRIAAALAVLALVAFGSTAAAQTTPKVEKKGVPQTAPTDAAGMFQTYCAACHGKEGKGNGPAAKALTKMPADLTQLSVKNGGTFPEAAVRRYIEGADETPAHGSRDMPIWGDLLRYAGGGENMVPLRIQGLVDYVKTLQK